MSEDIEQLVNDSFHRPTKLLFFDVETAPLLSFIWSLRQKHLSTNMLAQDAFLLSWAAKWSDSDTMHSRVLSPEEAKGQDDSRIVESLAELVRKADYVIGHNSDRFDVPMLNGRLLALGLEPIGTTQTIDTLKLARSSFRLASNKLDYLAEVLGIQRKHDTDFELWERCYRGEKKALSRMVAYNRNDVEILERVFTALKPYAKGLPRLVDGVEWRQESCPYCGSNEKTRDGYYRTKVNTFRRYRCRSCKRRYRHWQAIGSHKAGSVGL